MLNGNWKSSMKQGRQALRQGNVVQSKQQFGAALKLAERFGDEERLVETLCELADLYSIMGDASSAHEIIGRAVVIGKRILSRRKLDTLLKRADKLAQNLADSASSGA